MSGKMFSSKIGCAKAPVTPSAPTKPIINDLLKPNTEEMLALEWWKKDIAKYKIDDDTYQDLVNKWLKKENTIMYSIEIWATGEDDEDVLKIIWVTIGKQNKYLMAGGTDLCCNTHQEAVVQRVKDPRPQVRPKNLRRKGKAKASASSAKGITNQTTGAADTSDGSSNGDQEHYSNSCTQGNNIRMFTLKNVYYLLTCKTPLVSIGHFRKKGLAFTNDEEGFGVLYDTKDPQQDVETGLRVDFASPLTTALAHCLGVTVSILNHPAVSLVCLPLAALCLSPALTPQQGRMHYRLGHMSHSTIKTLMMKFR
ncbi:hypothetical protein EXIGLDRAFT_700830 [Exidia glandulosa HHB12029]|uniref:GAG-pre-integrase domain-containing protein n=1 Tax=Exidia glandulosa HHB12029 TaxID=1314781 RepID=A0A165DA57_EXIGL|nr:hypothetical protein EXIGLDRAFT_700830 [Exidia glandulosa HHB12029]